MSELKRHMYLSALGIDSYMPRWHLPCSPTSVSSKLSFIAINDSDDSRDLSGGDGSVDVPVLASTALASTGALTAANKPKIFNDLLGNMFPGAHSKKKVLSDGYLSQSAQVGLEKTQSVSPRLESFSLTIWRPIEGLMIIDSRNTQLALPTELLLAGILRSLLSYDSINTKSDVLRWPMVANGISKQSIVDARTELQTWLLVQCETLSVKFLWLMGDSAAIHFLPLGTSIDESLWKNIPLIESSIDAVILPSLNDLLQRPLLKRQLFSAIKSYHSKSYE